LIDPSLITEILPRSSDS